MARRSEVPSAPNSPAQIDNLTNGVAYVCRVFAENATGLSDASPISDAVSPCGSMLECTPILPPILAVIGAILAGLLLFVLVGLFRDRRRGYVVAVVDTIHSANLGHGSKLGLAFVRPPDSGRVTGIVADRSSKADIRIRPARGGRFVVTDKAGRQVATSGESIIATDSLGVRHDLVLRAFATKAASSVSSRH